MAEKSKFTMIQEVNEAKRFFKKKFGDKIVPNGEYAIPTETLRGKAFMRVVITNNNNLSDFGLWWDRKLTLSWYRFNKDGTKYGTRPAE